MWLRLSLLRYDLLPVCSFGFIIVIAAVEGLSLATLQEILDDL